MNPTESHPSRCSNPDLLLIGLRGAGKSTIGRALASRENRTFVDLDDLTLANTGEETIADVWRHQGEEAFRRAELDALGCALRGSGQIIALGGGTPTAVGADALIRQAQATGSVIVVYLREQPDELRRRLTGRIANDRPSLIGSDPLTEIEVVFRTRDELYCRLADRIIENVRSPDEALTRLHGWVNFSASSNAGT